GARHCCERRHRQQLVDLADLADQHARPHAIADAAPQARRVHPIAGVRGMLQRQPLVAGQDLERGEAGGRVHAALDSSWLMQASSSPSFTGLVMKARAPWRRPHTRSVSIALVVIITIGTSDVAGSRVSVRAAWQPLVPGRMPPMLTRAGGVLRTRSMTS